MYNNRDKQVLSGLIILLFSAIVVYPPFLFPTILSIPFISIGIALEAPSIVLGVALVLSGMATLTLVEFLLELSTAPRMLTAAASSPVLGLSTLAIGALALYGSIGVAYLFSAAKEGFESDNSVWNILKSRVVPNDGLSFKGVVNSASAVLWSPFLVLGGLAGKATKTIADVLGVRSKVTAIEGSDVSPEVKIESPFAGLSATAAPHASQNVTAPKTHVQKLIDTFEPNHVNQQPLRAPTASIFQGKPQEPDSAVSAAPDTASHEVSPQT